jgi:hypothetical protein
MNAREAVRFLDRVTSGKHGIPPSKIVLQGPMEQYETWEEAEQFLLPEFEEDAEDTLTSDAETEVDASRPAEKHEPGTEQSNEVQSLNEMSQMLLSKLNFRKETDAVSATSGGTRSGPASPTSGSSHTSPECTNAELATRAASTNTFEGSHIEGRHRSGSGSAALAAPAGIRPLLSSILWRLHSKAGLTSSINGCILVTNDRLTQTWAQKFGITAKNIHQLRTAIIYEEKEFKNHCKYMEKNPTTEPRPLLSYDDDSDEDVLVFVPRGRGKPVARGAGPHTGNVRKSAAIRTANGNANKIREGVSAEHVVELPSQPIDPDSFRRDFGVVKQNSTSSTSPNGVSRGFVGPSPRPGGGRRGGTRGGSFGGPRGRGRLWVP